jgi:hypothetical protein
MNVRIPAYAIGTGTDFLSSSSFWIPEHNPPSAWVGHAPFAFWLVDALKPRSIVELGVHSGFSYLALCQAVRQLKLDCICRGIDTWKGDEHSGFYGEEVYQELCRDHRRYSEFSRLIRSTFSEAWSQVPDGSIDLLHIDGRHHYEDVQCDFEMWKPKLSRRAIVLFHDTNEPNFGAGKFWKELRGTYPSFEFMHAHGLGVLGFGTDLPIKLEQLLAASEIASASQAIRTTYVRLGDAISDRQTLKRLEIEVQQIAETYMKSTSWRITAPVRAVATLARAFWGSRNFNAVHSRRQPRSPLPPHGALAT